MKLPEKLDVLKNNTLIDILLKVKINQLIDYLAEREEECDCCGWDDHGYQHEPTCSTKSPKRWRAGRAEGYWHLNTVGDVSFSEEIGDKYDDWRYESGNYFPTKEEVEAYKERLLSNFERE